MEGMFECPIESMERVHETRNGDIYGGVMAISMSSGKHIGDGLIEEIDGIQVQIGPPPALWGMYMQIEVKKMKSNFPILQVTGLARGAVVMM